eukprot:CAMPEP_0172630374 /NCGR_PEP_ID=MMETSP1068-20121228/173373_1 /TAXON_ID=35684 /ORGANISM="Pseudopedinella elastica, Strain CCMP716" /LENGTH=36 /DNA_ID= /DNA_START= /DNA_END= /DNA_ORIENTATION=
MAHGNYAEACPVGGLLAPWLPPELARVLVSDSPQRR